jgi:hypothetical protein
VGPSATPAPAAIAAIAAIARSTIVSLELSHVEACLAPLQRDLTAASDTSLGSSGRSRPTPNTRRILRARPRADVFPRIREAISSPRLAPLPSANQSARADPNGHLATLARPWGLLCPPTAQQAARHLPCPCCCCSHGHAWGISNPAVPQPSLIL